MFKTAFSNILISVILICLGFRYSDFSLYTKRTAPVPIRDRTPGAKKGLILGYCLGK